MRSRFLAIFGSISFSFVVLVVLVMNGRVVAKSEAAVGGSTGVPTTFRLPENGVEGNGDSTTPAISADGRFAAFASEATNLNPQEFDTNSFQDIFLYDLETTVITRVVGFIQTDSPNGDSKNPDISADGRFVAFESLATDLADGDLFDNNNSSDVFVYDRDGFSNSLDMVS